MGEGVQTMARVDSAGSDRHPLVYSRQRLEIIGWLGLSQGKNQSGRGATQMRR